MLACLPCDVRDTLSMPNRADVMRLVLQAVIIAAAAFLPFSAASADYPERPITMVVPYAAGGSNDALSRIIAEHMGRTLGQTVVIENDAGAAGTTPAARVAKSLPDGYTLIMGNMGTHGAAPAQYPRLKYDPAKDFTPIGLTAEVPAVLVTRKDFPAATLAEFIDYVRKNQDKVNEGHAGAGAPMHTFCTLLQSIMGTETARVAYRGGAPAMNDLVAGQIDFSCISLSGAIAQIRGGTVKALVVASDERVDLIESVPTSKEAGVPEFRVSAWNALFAPKGLQPGVQAKLASALDAALNDARTRERLREAGFVVPAPEKRGGTMLQSLVESEVVRWKKLLKPLGN